MGYKFSHYAEVDINKGVRPETLDGVLSTFDAYATEFSTKLFNGSVPIVLIDYAVTGYFTGSDGLTWRIGGELTDGIAYLTLPLGCLTKAGRFTLAIKIGSGINETTIRIIRGNVVATVDTEQWKDVKDFDVYQKEAGGLLTLTVTPYVDVKMYKVYEVIDGTPYWQIDMFGVLTRSLRASEGEHYYCVQPMLEDRDGTYIKGNMSKEIAVYVN